MKKQIFTIIVLIFVVSTCVTGAVPKTLSYQGVVTNTNGNPKKDGEYKFTFSIFDDSVTGESLWSEEKTIQTKQGLFSTELGSVKPLNLPFDTRYWLQVEADGTVFPQRTKLTGAPYSFRADTAEVSKKADTAQIAKGLVDSYYTKEQLRDSGEAKVHAGNIVNAEWLNELPSHNHDERYMRLTGATLTGDVTFNASKEYANVTDLGYNAPIKIPDFRTTEKNMFVPFLHTTTRVQTGYKKHVSLGSFRTGGSNWNGGIYFAQGGNDKYPTEYFLMNYGGAFTYKSADGQINSFYHSGNFNPDYMVQGTNSRRSITFNNDNQIDDAGNRFSSFFRMEGTDPASPFGGSTTSFGIRVQAENNDGYTLEINGRATPERGLFWGGLENGVRQTWREIWHSGNFTPETQSSDIRFKTDIDSIHDPLKKVKSLKGITFNWKHSDFPDRHFPQGRQIGVIAQEVEKILPEVIRTDKDGYKSVAYDKLSAILIEAVKQQQSVIDSLKNDLVKTKKDLESNNIELINFKNRLSKIENLIHSNDGE